MQEDQYYSSYIQKRYSTETQKLELITTPIRAPIGKPRILQRAGGFPMEGISLDEWQNSNGFESDYLQVNDLIPNFQKIRTEFVKHGLKITSTFGSTSSDPTCPENFVVSFGEGVELKKLQSVIKICLKYNLDGLAIARADHDFGKIYVGAYSYDSDDTKFAPITPELTETVLDESLTWKRLSSILKHTS